MISCSEMMGEGSIRFALFSLTLAGNIAYVMGISARWSAWNGSTALVFLGRSGDFGKRTATPTDVHQSILCFLVRSLPRLVNEAPGVASLVRAAYQDGGLPPQVETANVDL